MSLEIVRTAIVSLMQAVPGIGKVHAYERYAVQQRDFRDLYTTDGRLLGWHIRRVSSAERAVDTTQTEVVHRWRIQGVCGLEDGAATEIAFDTLIENLRAAFRATPTLGGLVTDMTDGDLAGLQLDDSGAAMFAGVLVHQARLTLQTKLHLPIADGALDDFLTFHADWDLPPFDQVPPLPVTDPDAADTVTLPGDPD